MRDRGTERPRNTEGERHKHRNTHRDRDTQRHRDTKRKGEIQRDRHTGRDRGTDTQERWAKELGGEVVRGPSQGEAETSISGPFSALFWEWLFCSAGSGSSSPRPMATGRWGGQDSPPDPPSDLWAASSHPLGWVWFWGAYHSSQVPLQTVPSYFY